MGPLLRVEQNRRAREDTQESAGRVTVCMWREGTGLDAGVCDTRHSSLRPLAKLTVSIAKVRWE